MYVDHVFVVFHSFTFLSVLIFSLTWGRMGGKFSPGPQISLSLYSPQTPSLLSINVNKESRNFKFGLLVNMGLYRSKIIKWHLLSKCPTDSLPKVNISVVSFEILNRWKFCLWLFYLQRLKWQSVGNYKITIFWKELVVERNGPQFGGLVISIYYIQDTFDRYVVKIILGSFRAPASK